MIFFLVTGTFLLVISFVVGAAILDLVKDNCFDRVCDHLIVSVWLGVVILAVILLTVSLFFPLSLLNSLAAMLSVSGLLGILIMIRGWTKSGLLLMGVSLIVGILFSRIRNPFRTSLLMIIILLFSCIPPLKSYLTSPSPKFSFYPLLPPKMNPATELVSKKVNDINYLQPPKSEDQCWAAQLPCTPEKLSNIQLRDSSQGIKGGFIKTSN